MNDARFPNGVQKYTKGIIQRTVNFPSDAIACCFCPYYRTRRGKNTGTDYGICTETYEYLNVVDVVHGIGKDCPIIEFKEDV